MSRQLAFRKRLLLILAAFALVPAVALTVAWTAAVGKVLPFVAENAGWDRVASSGTHALDSLRNAPLTPGQRAVLRAHEQALEQSATQARRFEFVAVRFANLMVAGAVLGLAVLALVASRVAGHLSRQLSRPLNELVGWAELIARGQELPAETPLRGAPEFRTLRERMRSMSRELTEGRARAVEAERLKAFRESARRFAHELKNPLTPIQFALARLERGAGPEQTEALEVLRTETARLEQMSRSFAQFGRLPEGPVSDVDVAELVRYTARATLPPEMTVEIRTPEQPIVVRGHHDALQRALSNVLLNAADACLAMDGNGRHADGARIEVAVEGTTWHGAPAVGIRVRDNGPGIPAERIENIWEPYVTGKPGGTGLGLAIARQAILAHHGSVSAANAPGGGTEIRFVLPRHGEPDTSNPG